MLDTGDDNPDRALEKIGVVFAGVGVDVLAATIGKLALPLALDRDIEAGQPIALAPRGRKRDERLIAAVALGDVR